MSKIGVELKIDVTKITKEKLYQGKKGTYLTMTAFIDPDNTDQYGNNGMITEKTTKEENTNGVKGAILGNASVFWRENGQGATTGDYHQQGQQQAPQSTSFDDGFQDDSIPF